MFKQALACVQSHQSLHCTRTCAKWAYIPHILSVNAQTSLIVCVVFLLSHMHEMGVHMSYFSVNAQTRLSMHAVLPEHSLLSHIHKMGVFVAYFISQCSNKPYHACSLTRAFTALAHAQNGLTYGIFFQSMLRRALLCVQSC